MLHTIRVQDPESGKWKTLQVVGNSKDAKSNVTFLRRAGFECDDPKRVEEKKNESDHCRQ